MAFASLDELKAQLDFELDDAGEANATSKLETASHYARHYSGVDWQDDTAVPGIVKSIVLNVVERYMRNPDGYTQSRAGDEAVQWSDRGASAPALYFHKDEIAILKTLSAPAGFGSVGTYQWNNRAYNGDTLTVPVLGGGDPFPLFAFDDPWAPDNLA